MQIKTIEFLSLENTIAKDLFIGQQEVMAECSLFRQQNFILRTKHVDFGHGCYP